MKISDRRLRISDSLKISDFSNSSIPKHSQQYGVALGVSAIQEPFTNVTT